MATPTLERERARKPVGPRSRRRWAWLVVLVALAVVGALVTAWLVNDNDDPPGSLGRVDPETFFGEWAQLATSGGATWAWDGAGRIGRYDDGAWQGYGGLPDGAGVLDVAVDADGRVLASTSIGVYRLEESGWRLHPAWSEVDDLSVTLEVDPVTGIEWWSTSDGLFRWDGDELTNIADPTGIDMLALGEILATGDGSLWAGGMYGYIPSVGGLVRYHDDSRTWEVVRPLGGTNDVPAHLLASPPDGGVWAMLADWSEDWEDRQESGEPYVQWSLAHFDDRSREWTVYRDDLPPGYPGAMSADEDAVWLSQGGGLVADIELSGGLYRFDGHTWTTYLEGQPVEDVAVAEDGTVWVSVLDEPGVNRVTVDPEPGG